MSEINVSIENYFDDLSGMPIEWKGLDVTKKEHLALLHDYALEHTSESNSLKIEAAIATFTNPKALEGAKGKAFEIIEQGFCSIDVDYLFSYLEAEAEGDPGLRWFYAQYGLYEPEQIYEIH